MASCLVLVGSALGCTYKPLAGSSIGYKLSPNLSREAQAAGEANLYVQGWLERSWQQRTAPLFVVALGVARKKPEVVAIMPVDQAGAYGMYLPASEYLLLAYVDRNGDARLDRAELVGYRKPRVFLAADGPSAQFDLDLIIDGNIAADLRKLAPKSIDVEEISQPDLAYAKSLRDPRFGDEEGTEGLINPNLFLQKHQLIEFVGEPDFTDGRTPVVMVHGIDGTPSVFRTLSEGLDERFSAWYFYYPSGARLPASAEILNHLVFSGQFLPRMPSALLVAHSMGGMVSRAALNRHRMSALHSRHSPTKVPLYLSFVTPYGGVSQANTGIRNSPFFVPSWVDVASGSDFQKSLFAPLEEGTEFHLFAGNGEGNSDGTILLTSQKFAKAVEQATSVSTFPQSHVGIMRDEAAISASLQHLRSLVEDEPVSAAPAQDGALALDVRKSEPALSSPERLRRAELVFGYFQRALDQRSIPFRVMRVTGTALRMSIGEPKRNVVLVLAVGRGLRAEFPRSTRAGISSAWTQPNEALPEGAADEAEAAGFYEEVLETVESELTAPDVPPPEKTLVAPALPPAPSWTSPYPPPVHLFAGVAGTGNLGAQYLTLRVPLEFSMYFGSFGFGTDARLPLLSPVIREAALDVIYRPFGFGLGPRLRFGHKRAPVSGSLGLNFATEMGVVAMTEAESGHPRPGNEPVDKKFRAAVGGYGSAHVGFRLSQDFYLRTGADVGTLFSSVRVDVEGEELILLQPVFLNVLLGAEIRIP